MEDSFVLRNPDREAAEGLAAEVLGPLLDQSTEWLDVASESMGYCKVLLITIQI